MTDTEYAPMDMRRSLQPVGRTFAASQTATPAAILAMKGLPASTRAILLAITNIADGSLILVLPDGRRLRFGDADGPCATMQIHSHRFAKRVLAEGESALPRDGSRMNGTSPDLTTLLSLLAGNAERFMNVFRGGPVGQALNWLTHLTRANSRRGARRNIMAHYDLGNAFFEAWLDPSMTYSAARFDLAEGLEQAQHAKYRALADRVALKPGERVLERRLRLGAVWPKSRRGNMARMLRQSPSATSNWSTPARACSVWA